MPEDPTNRVSVVDPQAVVGAGFHIRLRSGRQPQDVIGSDICLPLLPFCEDIQHRLYYGLVFIRLPGCLYQAVGKVQDNHYIEGLRPAFGGASFFAGRAGATSSQKQPSGNKQSRKEKRTHNCSV